MEALEFRAKFKEKLHEGKQISEFIILANNETSKYQNSVYVIVEDVINKEVMCVLSVNCVIPETFYRGITFINNCLVIAVENYIYMFNVKSREHFQFKIDGFFDSFCIEDKILLVRSDTHVTCIDSNNKVIWNSERVASDNDFMKRLSYFPDQNLVDFEKEHNWSFLKLHYLTGLYLEN